MRISLQRIALGSVLCLASLASVYSQAAPTDSSSVDQLFESPQADTETQSSDAAQLLDTFHAQPLSVTGSFSSWIGGVAGYSDGKSSATGAYDGSYRFGWTPGLSFVPSLTFTARPDETIRFQGTVSFPFAATNMFTPSIDEMFFDYTLKDLVYFRLGKHLVSWGVSRIFDAGGDLMADSNAGLDLKITVPIGKGGVTAITLTPQTFFSGEFPMDQLKYGLQVDLPIASRSELILSGRYDYNDSSSLPLRGTAVLKTSLFGVDLFAEGIGASTLAMDAQLSTSPELTGIVSGFFWERVDPEYKIYGEYYFNALDTSMRDHRVSLVVGADKAFGSPFNMAIQWTHAFIDNSGIVVPGVSVGLLPHISLQVGLPIRYGAPGSFYFLNQSPIVTTSTLPTSSQVWDQRYGFLLRLNLSASF